MLVHSAADVLDYWRAPAAPLDTQLERFLHYLRFEFYSFGSFVTRDVRLPTGERMTATLDIGIRERDVPGFRRVANWHPAAPAIGWESPLFDRYRFARTAAGPTVVVNDHADRTLAARTSGGADCTTRISPAITASFGQSLIGGLAAARSHMRSASPGARRLLARITGRGASS